MKSRIIEEKAPEIKKTFPCLFRNDQDIVVLATGPRGGVVVHNSGPGPHWALGYVFPEEEFHRDLGEFDGDAVANVARLERLLGADDKIPIECWDDCKNWTRMTGKVVIEFDV